MKYLSILLFVLSAITAAAQKINDPSLKHTTKQNGLSMQFVVLPRDAKGIKQYDEHKTYYWHKAQMVIGTQGGSSGQLLDGTFESFYTNKQLCEKGAYAKGLKNGKWNHWRADGTLIKQEQWANGVKKGKQLEYSAKGKIQKETIIRGRKAAPDKTDTLVELSGKYRSVTLNDSLGNPISVAHYRNNQLHGKQVTYGPTGEKTTVSYKNGIPREEKKSGKTTKEKKEKGRIKKFFSKKEKQEQKASTEKKERKKLFGKKKTAAEEPKKEKKPLFNRKSK